MPYICCFSNFSQQPIRVYNKNQIMNPLEPNGFVIYHQFQRSETLRSAHKSVFMCFGWSLNKKKTIHRKVAGTRVDHWKDFFRRVTGTGQQVAQLRDGYLHEDVLIWGQTAIVYQCRPVLLNCYGYLMIFILKLPNFSADEPNSCPSDSAVIQPSLTL